MHRALQGRCGLFCGECKIYIAYSTDNSSAQKEIAKTTGKVKGRNMSPEQVKCLGCKGTMASTWRTGCAIRACAEERGMEFCYQCRVYPCDLLQKFHENHPEAKENLKTISKVGPDAWLHNKLIKNRTPEKID
ncbi:MAG TPA: hypothetical protein DCZ43_12905 [candidate division Zixibacteria bacterium]|nr:hypothetical protein [candidate division Zixibacteria bacterium]